MLQDHTDNMKASCVLMMLKLLFLKEHFCGEATRNEYQITRLVSKEHLFMTLLHLRVILTRSYALLYPSLQAWKHSLIFCECALWHSVICLINLI
jgi:hypothetical protein